MRPPGFAQLEAVAQNSLETPSRVFRFWYYSDDLSGEAIRAKTEVALRNIVAHDVTF